MNANDLYKQGKLNDAVTAALDDVKKNPSDGAKRTFLCELLCLTGDLERADKQLDALAQLDPDALMPLALFRQLIRAEQARQQFFTEGRLPEFLDQQITPNLSKHLEAAILIREKKPSEAANMLAAADEIRPKVSGVCDGKPFDEIRDLDDLTSSFFEVFTSTGKYYWIPFERVDSVEFHPLERPRDLLWRGAHMIVRNGPDGVVYIPTLYPGSAAEKDDQYRLGRATEWRGEDGVPIRGAGQRVFLIGEDDKSILEVQSMQFTL
ncbi:MAG TPA: type VI secretion system accessory protein TagJ [Gemmataceae bacterium]|nr:type VI secretion system accessory protein TagJ [Gemmataceae bacterium]